MANPTFLDYRMPTTFDVPESETILVEVPNPASPHGIRGVGGTSGGGRRSRKRSMTEPTPPPAPTAAAPWRRSSFSFAERLS